nr:hypothetical protein Iba_chr03bCG2780 [Ipomoea batatas]
MGRFPPGNIDPAGESIRLNHTLFHRVNAEKFEQETGVHDHHPRQSFVVDIQVLVVRGSNPGHAFLHELVNEFLELEAFWEQFGVPLGGVELESGSEAIRALGTLKMVAGVTVSSSSSWMNDSLMWIIHRVSSGFDEAVNGWKLDIMFN